MSTHSSESTRRRMIRGLALAGISALALAASPTALAKDRGRPGAPSVQPSLSNPVFGFRPKLPGRFVSWSD